MQIYIAEGTQQTGPFDLDTIRTGLNSGKYQPTQLAWYEGAPGWEPISKLPGMEAAVAPPPPSAAPPPAAPPQAYSPAPPPSPGAYSPAPSPAPGAYSPTPGSYSPAPPPYSPAPPPGPYNPGATPPAPYGAPPSYNAPYGSNPPAPYGPGAGGAPPKKSLPALIGGIVLALISVGFGVSRLLFTGHSYGDSSSSSYSSSSYNSTPSYTPADTPTPTPTPATPTPAPAATPRQDLVTYRNTRSDYPTGERAAHFIAFTVNRPKYWGSKWSNSTQDKRSFLELEHKRTVNGSFDTTEQVNIGVYNTAPGMSAAATLPVAGPLFCSQVEAALKKTFPNLTRDWQAPNKINGYAAYDYCAHSTQKDKTGKDITLWSRIILVAPPTGPDGVVIMVTSSSYEPEITKAQDVGFLGDSGTILGSFRF